MSPEDRPDYADLMRSPYDADPDPGPTDDGGSIPWVPPVVAAIVGALVVSGFVIYAVAQEPETEQAQTTTTTQASEPVPVASEGVPQGFTSVTEDVGARVERLDVTSRGTVAAVSTATPGDREPEMVAPLDPAYWVLRDAGAESPMLVQYDEAGAVGNITIEFAPIAELRDPAMIPYLADGIVTEVETLDLDATVPQTLTDVVIDLPSAGTIVVEELTIADNWGWFAWSGTEGRVAKIDVVVTFLETDDPETPDDVDATLLTPPHLQRLRQGIGSLPLPPMFGFSGSSPLVRSGEPLWSGNEPTGILVEFTVTTPTSVTRGPTIEIRTDG